MSALTELRDGWNHAAREDAMFNILTAPEYAGNSWPPDLFFQTGKDEIIGAMEWLERLGFDGPRKRALDFGCGVGRLTLALSEYYEDALGVDISAEMIERAKVYAKHYGRKNARFKLSSSGLPNKTKYDLIYSRLVLQHMPKGMQHQWVKTFVQRLTPNGQTCFQVVDGPDYAHPNAWLSMHGVAEDEVYGWVQDAGGEVRDLERQFAGQWTSCRFVAVIA